MPHDGYAFAYIVGAIALNLGTRAFGIRSLADYSEFACVVIEIGEDISEAVDAGDNLRSVLAKTVKDDAERLFADEIGLRGDFDCTFSGSE
jgi:hypothetical protein